MSSSDKADHAAQSDRADSPAADDGGVKSYLSPEDSVITSYSIHYTKLYDAAHAVMGAELFAKCQLSAVVCRYSRIDYFRAADTSAAWLAAAQNSRHRGDYGGCGDRLFSLDDLLFQSTLTTLS